MNKSVVISGYGSIGRRHANILSGLVKRKNITILTNQKISNFHTIKTLKAINSLKRLRAATSLGMAFRGLPLGKDYAAIFAAIFCRI